MAKSDEIHTVHDSYFKALMDLEGVLQAFLREHLPAEAVAMLKLETARRCNAELVDKELAKRLMDKLVRIDTVAGDLALALMLLEHKSWPDKWVVLQLAGYVVRVHEVWHREHETSPLPPIKLLVVYHGKTPWEGERRYGVLVDDSGFTDHCRMDLVFDVVDVGQIPDDSLSEHPLLRVGLMVLKYATRGVMGLKVVEALALGFRGLGVEFIKLSCRYMAQTFREEYWNMLIETMGRVAPQEAEMAESYADSLVGKREAQAEARGKAEGKAEGKMLSILRLLELRFGGVLESSARRVRTAREPRLDTWFARSLGAASIEEALAES